MNCCKRCCYHTDEDVCPYCGDFIGDYAGPDDPRQEPEGREDR